MAGLANVAPIDPSAEFVGWPPPPEFSLFSIDLMSGRERKEADIGNEVGHNIDWRFDKEALSSLRDIISSP